jgi:hypothetical protein
MASVFVAVVEWFATAITGSICIDGARFNVMNARSEGCPGCSWRVQPKMAHPSYVVVAFKWLTQRFMLT